jgi:hypothetical protein
MSVKSTSSTVPCDTLARKDAKSGGDLLFEIEPEPVFRSKTADGTRRGPCTGSLAERDRV